MRQYSHPAQIRLTTGHSSPALKWLALLLVALAWSTGGMAVYAQAESSLEPPPPELRVSITEGMARLSADVLSPAHLRLLDRALRLSQPDREIIVESRMDYSRSASWMLESELVTRIAALLESGEAVVADRSIRITGTTAFPDMQAGLVSRLEAVADTDSAIDYSVTAVSADRLPLETLCRSQFYFLTQGKRLDFATVGAELGSGSLTILDGIAELMSDCPDLRIQVTGHTDARGGDDVNRQVSLQRATTVVDYLVGLGLARERFSAVGAGASDPLVPQEDVSAVRFNRRVELSLL